MKSVGEVMAIGRTFPEALLKGMRSHELASDVLPDAVADDEREASARRGRRAERGPAARSVPAARGGRDAASLSRLTASIPGS
jgi:hypothetical protein